jgi:hypothetical protein
MAAAGEKRRMSVAAIHLVQATLGHAAVVTTRRHLHAGATEGSAEYLAV